MPRVVMSKANREWRAKEDARTLAESQVILSDKGRLIQATKAAKQIAAEASKQADAMKKVASKKPSPRKK